MATETTSQPWRFLCFCPDDFSICVSTKGTCYWTNCCGQCSLYSWYNLNTASQTGNWPLLITSGGLQLTHPSVSLLNKLYMEDPKSTVRRYSIVLHMRKLSIFFKSCHSYSWQILTTEQGEPRGLDVSGHEVISISLCLSRRSVANEMRWESETSKESFVIFQLGEETVSMRS